MESVSRRHSLFIVPSVFKVFRNDFGIRCVIAPSFGDIFRNNAMQNGMLPIVLPADVCKELAADAEAGVELEVDLEKQEVRRPDSKPSIPFSVDPFRRHCLLNGLDDIALTLQKEGSISTFEQRRTAVWPWLDGFSYRGGRIPATTPKTDRNTEW